MSTPKPEGALVPIETAMPAHPSGSGDILYDSDALEHSIRLAERLARSQLLPERFRNKPDDVLFGIMMARKMGEDLATVMSAIHFVNGKPGWAGPFLIARANASGVLVGQLDFETTGSGEDLAVTCSAVLRSSGKRVSRTVSLRMAREDGWTKNAKYRSMPEQMLTYRSAAFFVRTFCPGIIYGLRPVDELEDVEYAQGRHVLSTYEDPSPSSSPPRERLERQLPAPLGVEHVAGGDDLSSVEAPPGAGLALPAEGSTPSTSRSLSSPADVPDPKQRQTPQADDTSSSPSSPSDGSPHAPSGTSSAPTGQEGPGDADAQREAVLAEVAALREECSTLLREEAQALGLRSPAKAPTLRLRELVTATRGRRPLLSLTDEALHERWHAAVDAVGDADYAAVLAQRYGLPVVDGRPVTDGAPRAWIERCLVTLLLVAEQRQQQRQDEAVRATLLEQAREVLADLHADVAGEAFERLGLLTLDDASEEQLRALVVLGRGPQGGGT